MPTIVTKIVQDMFHSQRSKRQFANSLRDLPAGDATTSASDTEDSDAESLDKSVDTSREVAKLTANRPRDEFFMWGAELSRSRDLHVLKLDEDVNEEEEHHMLLLKQVCLGINAIEGERNVVEIHTTDFSDKEQRHPIVSLTLGRKDFANLDLALNWTKTKEIKFKLVMGSGPVTITGNHHVEHLNLPTAEEIEDPDFVAEETDDETEISTFEDPEEISENELKELAEDKEKPVGAVAAPGSEGKRKRAASPCEPTTKKRKSDSEDVSVKEVDLKA